MCSGRVNSSDPGPFNVPKPVYSDLGGFFGEGEYVLRPPLYVVCPGIIPRLHTYIQHQSPHSIHEDCIISDDHCMLGKPWTLASPDRQPQDSLQHAALTQSDINHSEAPN